MTMTAQGDEQEATQVEALSVPEDATSEDFLESARKAALEEVGVDQQLNDGELREGSESSSQDDSTPTDESQESAESDAELDKPFVGSRREAYRLAEERLQALRDAETKNAELSAQLERQQKEDEALLKEVTNALGTDEEYRELTRRSRQGDVNAGRLLDQIEANRTFFSQLQKKAQRDITTYFTASLVKSAEEAGLPKDLVFQGEPHEIVKTAYTNGFEKAKSDADKVIKSLEAEIRGLKAGRATAKQTPLAGGQSSRGTAFDDLIGEDGLPTDESIAAAKAGNLRGI